MDKKKFWIGGNHSVIAALNNKKRVVYDVVTTEQNPYLDKKKIKYTIKNKKFFSKIFHKVEISHQGIAALVSLPNYQKLENIFNEETINNIIMLDGITDPMNLGTIIRNSLAFNIDLIIVNEREFNDSSPAMIKSASGAIERINICKVKNLLHAINFLKKKNFWIVGLDSESNKDITNHKWNNNNAFLFGSEGYGIKKILKINCDYLLKININKKIESLNVSSAVAATLAIFNKQNSI